MSRQMQRTSVRKWMRRGLVTAVFVGVASSPLWWNAAGFAQERQPAQSQDQKQQQPPDEQQMAEMMQKFEEAAKPGKFHELLKPYAGRWQVSAVFGAPGAEMTSKGQATNEWVLGERFLKQEFSGDMMGQQFNGIGYTGYDNTSKQYQSVWLDSMSSAMFVTEGEASDDGRTLTFTGQAADPMTGEMKNFRHVMKLISNDQYLYEMYEPGPGGEMNKSATLTYNRAE